VALISGRCLRTKDLVAASTRLSAAYGRWMGFDPYRGTKFDHDFMHTSVVDEGNRIRIHIRTIQCR
jgi:hypothetical protein